MKSLVCNPCKQARSTGNGGSKTHVPSGDARCANDVFNIPMRCHVLSEDNFVNVVELVRKSFYFCEFCDTYAE